MSNLLGLGVRFPRACWIAVLALTCASTLLLVLAPPASAALEVDPSYTQQQLVDASSAPYDCYGRWSGGADGDGTHYVACDGEILVVDRAGRLVNAIGLPASARAVRDVAATFDGSVVYYIAGAKQKDCITATSQTNYGADVGSVRRAVRQSNGTYQWDAMWKIPPVDFGGTCDDPGQPTSLGWSFRGIDVDRAGGIYATVDAYVYLYSAQGTLIDAFGGDAANVTPYNGGLVLPQGLSVTPDGTSVYVVEQQRNFLQRWDRQLDGRWIRSSWRIGTPYRNVDYPNGYPGLDCVNPFLFASPYDVDLDGSGNIMLLDVSCHRIVRFTNEGTTFLGTVWKDYPAGGNTDQTHHIHGFSTDFLGTMVIGDQGKRYMRTAADTANDRRCLPDWDAPRIVSLTGPARSGQQAVLQLSATDACSAVEDIRITGDHTGGTDWQPFSANPTVALTTGDGPKTINVRVRDHYGRASTIASVTTTLDTTVAPKPPAPPAPPNPPDLRLRAYISVYGPRRSCLPRPASALSRASAKSYRLADSCARISGIVVSSKRIRGGRLLQLRVSAATAKRLYRNADGPVSIWVIGTSRTRAIPHRPVRVGRVATITGALFASRTGATITLAPAGQWYGPLVTR